VFHQINVRLLGHLSVSQKLKAVNGLLSTVLQIFYPKLNFINVLFIYKFTLLLCMHAFYFDVK